MDDSLVSLQNGLDLLRVLLVEIEEQSRVVRWFLKWIHYFDIAAQCIEEIVHMSDQVDRQIIAMLLPLQNLLNFIANVLIGPHVLSLTRLAAVEDVGSFNQAFICI